MSARGRRRLVALGVVLEKQRHELTARRRDLAEALRALHARESALATARADVAAAEDGLRGTARTAEPLRLDTLETWRHYLSARREALREARAEHAGSERAVDELERDVAEGRAHARAVERASRRLESRLTADAERAEGRRLEDAWLQRRRYEDDGTDR